MLSLRFLVSIFLCCNETCLSLSLSDRLCDMKLKDFQLERYFAKYELNAPHLLCCSDCESLSIRDLLQFDEGAQDKLLSLGLGYTESLGSPELRTQVASLYAKASFESIIVHAGSEEPIFNFMNVALNQGDEIIVPAPSYQSLGEVARSIGAKVIEWESSSKNSWQLELDFLKNIVTDKTRVVVINFPHNPTGTLPGSKFIHDLSKLSDERGFIVFSDEMYRGLEYDANNRLPPFTDLNEKGVSLGGMAKTYALPGLRIGWIATRNKDLFYKLAAFKDYTTICNSAPGEFLATLALRNRNAIVERNLRIIKGNLHILNHFFKKHEELFDWQEPQAGPIAFPRYRCGSVAAFCKQLVQDTGVLLLPGTLFNGEYNCFRIGFGRKNMVDCVHRLEQFIGSP